MKKTTRKTAAEAERAKEEWQRKRKAGVVDGIGTMKKTTKRRHAQEVDESEARASEAEETVVEVPEIGATEVVETERMVTEVGTAGIESVETLDEQVDEEFGDLAVSPSDNEEEAEHDIAPTSFNSIPKIEPFGDYERSKRRARFHEWLREVKRAMVFAKNWDEERGSAWLGLVCGSHLHRLIDIYSIVSKSPKRPFSGLLEAIDQKFNEMMDETVEYQRLVAFKQGDSQPVSDFYEKYMDLVNRVGEHAV